ncbi:putative VPS74-protein [Exidia glandulosa HHB12029]|uniref:Putative VPS74-protein n=1 Tax=Exidia glandulosa HHB12029 TaxID=1314781 RepID=A0A166BPU9_EXIGL|nr:putative VPS74-protein [Exidia glandulosa HHB12029]
MSSTTGLSRRRIAQPSQSEENSAPSHTSPTSSTSNLTRPQHAGTAFEGGGRVAYDPRDLEGEDEAKKMPKLTLLEEILLLGIKDRAGYLSFWNDNISYALRGCIIIELALRRRIAVVREPARRRLPLPDRLIEVVDARQTGETILDEALKMMQSTQDTEKMGAGQWVDLLSGETWNVMKIGFQLKQVRERLAKGLVDKGVLRTEKRSFVLFDMATHPVADATVKASVVNRVKTLLTCRTNAIPDSAYEPGIDFAASRAASLACAAYAASVLDNALDAARLGFDEREEAAGRCDDVLAEFAQWPFGAASNQGASNRRRAGEGSAPRGKEAVHALLRDVRKEMGEEDGPLALHFEVVAAVMEVFSRMDSLL